MKQFYALLALTFFSNLSPAQDLATNSPIKANIAWNKTSDPSVGGETPARKPQPWEKEQDRVNGSIPHSKLAKMKNSMDSLAAFLQDSCISEGPATAVWHGEYIAEKGRSGALLKFGLQCSFPGNNGPQGNNAEQGNNAQLMIMANDLSLLLDHLVVNHTDYLTMQPPVAVRNDCQYFESGEANGQTNGQATEDAKHLRSRIWLVTTGHNQLPYTAITRKEYLQEARTELDNTRLGVIADLKEKMPVRPTAVQEADKAATLDQLNHSYSGIDLQIRTRMFLKNYKSDEDYLKENTEKGTADLDSTLHIMDSLLHHLSADELGKPAMVSVQAADFRGFEDGHAGQHMLIKMNPAYFDAYLGGEKPQLFLVYWRYDPSEPMADGIDRQLRERFDGRKLKEMLGK